MFNEVDVEFWKEHTKISSCESGLELTKCWSTHKNYKLKVGDSVGTRQYMRDGIPHAWRVRVFNKSFLVHRIIYTMEHGPIKDSNVIDHIDGNPFNNSIENLREVDFTQNSRNARVRKDNKTGYPGINILDNNCGQLYVIATYKLDKKPVTKLWPLSKWSYEAAVAEARQWLLDNKSPLGFSQRALKTY